MWTTIPPTPAPETLSQIRDLTDSVSEATGRAGTLILDAYEAALESIAACQEQAARDIDVDWISTVLDAQAKLTRELARISGSAVRKLLP
jgi:hypothetical protein